VSAQPTTRMFVYQALENRARSVSTNRYAISSRFRAPRAAFHLGDYHIGRARPAPPAAGPPARAAAPLAGEAARVPDGMAAKYLKRTTFGTRGVAGSNPAIKLTPTKSSFSETGGRGGVATGTVIGTETLYAERPRQWRGGPIAAASSWRTPPSQPRASARGRGPSSGQSGGPELSPQEFFFERIAVGCHGHSTHIRVP
jgi:hypothetical protein